MLSSEYFRRAAGSLYWARGSFDFELEEDVYYLGEEEAFRVYDQKWSDARNEARIDILKGVLKSLSERLALIKE